MKGFLEMMMSSLMQSGGRSFNVLQTNITKQSMKHYHRIEPRCSTIVLSLSHSAHVLSISNIVSGPCARKLLRCGKQVPGPRPRPRWSTQYLIQHILTKLVFRERYLLSTLVSVVGVKEVDNVAAMSDLADASSRLLRLSQIVGRVSQWRTLLASQARLLTVKMQRTWICLRTICFQRDFQLNGGDCHINSASTAHVRLQCLSWIGFCWRRTRLAWGAAIAFAW